MAAWTDAVRRIQAKIEFDWSKSAVWVDESQYLLSASGKQSMLLPHQLLGGNVEQPAWGMQLALRNVTSRFNPLHSSGALYDNIKRGKFYAIPVRFSVGLWNGSSYDYTRIFTGYVKTLRVIESTKTATIVCDDNTLPFIQHRASDNVETNQKTDTYLSVLKMIAGVGTTDFDSGLNTVGYCWIDSERVWNEMNEIAHSEFGRVGFDRNGTCFFRNAESWEIDSVHTTSQHTFSTSRIADVALPFDWKSTFNEVEVPYAPRREIGTIQVYKLPRSFILLPGETRTITARYKKAVVTTSTPVANTDYVIIDEGGNDLSGSVTISATYYGQRASIEITNDHATKAVNVVRFNIFGNALDGAQTSGEPRTVTDADIGTSITKTYRLSPNAYIQSKAQSDFLAEAIIANTKVARQMFRVKGANAIPTLEPGHRVTIPTLDAGNFAAFLTNIDWSFDGGVYIASYDAIEADNWYPNSGDYHEITDLFSADKKAFI